MATLRQDSLIWLIGPQQKILTGMKLPSKREVLALFFHHHVTEKQTIRSSASKVASDLLDFWNRARIPCKLQRNLIPFIEKQFKHWQSLKKHQNRNNPADLENQRQFCEDLDELFDIARPNALEIITIQEDKDFLLAQREHGRRGSMGSVDSKLVKKEKLAAERNRVMRLRQQINLEKCSINKQKITLVSSSEESESESVVEEPNDKTTPKAKRAKKSLISPILASALDRAKVSDRGATFIVAATAQSLGHNLDDYSINRSSIRRHRASRRRLIASQLKGDFNPNVPLTVHWDGKLLPDIVGKEIVDRLPVLVSGADVEQLIGVPKLPGGTGEEMATAIYDLVKDWGIDELIKCECFDTTSSNTGIRAGACVILEQKLDRHLLQLACRHHIHEIILEATVTTCLGPSTGPEINIFKRFQAHWHFIDQSKYEAAQVIQCPGSWCFSKQEVVTFAKKQLQLFHPRDDYKELLELCIIFVGGKPDRGVHFRAPAGLHRARWMAKAMYSIKIYLFRGQFKLTKREEKALFDISQFVVLIYIKAWFLSPSPVRAPLQDFNFLKSLDMYKNVHPDISKVATKKMLGHLWYLGEELVTLALFDESVSCDTKQNIVAAMNDDEMELDDYPRKRAILYQNEIQNCVLEQFASKNSLKFFEILGLPVDFLNTDPTDWFTDDTYMQSFSIASKLRVVNDNAERGVALINEYNAIITRNEEQKQFLLQVVSQHRKNFPNCKKSTLSTSQI